jgi:hypothetical protein
MGAFQRQQRGPVRSRGDFRYSAVVANSLQEFSSRVHGALSTIVRGGESEHPGSGVKEGMMVEIEGAMIMMTMVTVTDDG